MSHYYWICEKKIYFKGKIKIKPIKFIIDALIKDFCLIVGTDSCVVLSGFV